MAVVGFIGVVVAAAVVVSKEVPEAEDEVAGSTNIISNLFGKLKIIEILK